MTDLAPLIARVRAATEPDWKLDAGIAKAVGWTTRRGAGSQPMDDWIPPGGGEYQVSPPRFTGSIDVAVTLIPDGCILDHLGMRPDGWRAVVVTRDLWDANSPEGPIWRSTHMATAPLAVAASALMARQAVEVTG